MWPKSMPHPSYGITGDLAAEFSVWCAHDLEYPGQLVDVLTTHIITQVGSNLTNPSHMCLSFRNKICP